LFLQASGVELLADSGKVSALEARIHAEGEFEKYRIIQAKLFESDMANIYAKITGEFRPYRIFEFLTGF